MLRAMRRIAVITTSRADYGHLIHPLRRIDQHPELALELIVMGAHHAEAFGHTVDAIRADGFEIAARIEHLDPEDSDAGMARTIGEGVLGLTEHLAASRPDLLLLIADRYEMLAPAAVALALRIPIAHIEGGDVSEGAVDDAVRNALTKMAHLHFTPTEQARRRVLAMGEEPWRVIRSGAPSLDHLVHSEIPSRAALEATLGHALSPRACVVACHPVTLLADTTEEVEALFRALAVWEGQLVFCFPNADAGYGAIVQRARSLCAARPDALGRADLHVNLDHLSYWSLLRHAGLMVGNSSSGIMESPSLALPTVDVGIRQRGRERAANVLHAPAEADAILAALRRAADPSFREGLGELRNPYGDGDAAERIVAALAELPGRDVLLFKRALPLDPARPGDAPAFRADGEDPARSA